MSCGAPKGVALFVVLGFQMVIAVAQERLDPNQRVTDISQGFAMIQSTGYGLDIEQVFKDYKVKRLESGLGQVWIDSDLKTRILEINFGLPLGKFALVLYHEYQHAKDENCFERIIVLRKRDEVYQKHRDDFVLKTGITKENKPLSFHDLIDVSFKHLIQEGQVLAIEEVLDRNIEHVTWQHIMNKSYSDAYGKLLTMKFRNDIYRDIYHYRNEMTAYSRSVAFNNELFAMYPEIKKQFSVEAVNIVDPKNRPVDKLHFTR